MSALKPEEAPAEDDSEAGPESDVGAAAAALEVIAAAKLQGDVDGLLKLAKQHRGGHAGAPPDMAACLAAYRAAADLGSSVAQHAVGLFHLNGGGGVERSERDAALQFRAAADQGHLPSKVLVGNFYELGIHYRADAAKADVWYRNVARSASVEDEPDSPAYVAALANLGCVRYCLSLADAAETTEAERARLLRLARAYGYRPDGGRPSLTIAGAQLDAVEAEVESQRGGGAPRAEGKPAAASPEAEATVEERKNKTRARPAQGKVNVGLASTGFFLTLIFMAIGVVLGHVLRHAALEEIAAGRAVPVFGQRAEAILPSFVVALGVLPNLLFYRASAFIKALLIAGAAAIGGEILWGMGRHFLDSRVMQITDLGVAGMLVGLLVFGLFGGVKPGSK